MVLGSVRQLRAAARDDRWGDNPNVPGTVVPGSGGKTMSELWDEAESLWDVPQNESNGYGWGKPITARGSLAGGGASISIANRRLFQWYNPIAIRARQAVLEKAVYGPSKLILAELGVTPLCGNYLDSYADGAADSSAWMNVRELSPDDDTQTPPKIESNTVARFTWLSGDQNSRLLNYGGLGLWYTWPSIAPATNTINMPPLYAVDTTAFFHHLQGMYILYLPDHPAETPFVAQRRVNRQRTETSINSFGGGRQDITEPYWPFPEETIDGVYFSRDKVRDLLAENVRAKEIKVLHPWRGPPNETEPNGAKWSAAKEIYQQVYAFKIDQWKWLGGHNEDYTVHPLGDITNTLRGPANSPYGSETVLVIDSDADDGDNHYTEAEADFVPWETAAPGNGLKIYFENSIEISGLSAIENPAQFPAYGYVYVWDYNDSSVEGGWWRAVEFNDDATDPKRYLFGTHDLSTRRAIVIEDAGNYVSSSGNVKLLFRHAVRTAELPNETFRSKHDLVQVVRIDGTAPGFAQGGGEGGNSMSQSVTGADVDRNGMIDAADVSRFGAALQNGSGLADYNGDDSITPEDLTAFLSDFSHGG